MKPLAILRDSLREALDSKVFYVAAALSCLLIGVVGSFSFKPVPADDALPYIANKISSEPVRRDRGRSVFDRLGIDPPHFEITDIHALTDNTAPQNTDYRFHVNVHETMPGGFKRAVYVWNSPPDTPIPPAGRTLDVPASLLEEYVQQQLIRVGSLDVAKIELLPDTVPGARARNYRYVVETKGTRGNRAWLNDPYAGFGMVPLKFLRTTMGLAVFLTEAAVVNGIGATAGLILGVVITGFFIPNMLRKGTVDLLLVKPVRRSTLLVYKYLGGLSFMFLNAVLAIGGMWLVLGLRSGIWGYQFLLSIAVITFYFAVLYSVSTLAAVLTRSTIVAILATCFTWLMLYLVGSGYQYSTMKAQAPLREDVPKWMLTTINVLHDALPRAKDLDFLNQRLLSEAALTESEAADIRAELPEQISWGASVTVCLAFIAVMLGLSCWRFAREDF